MIVCLIVAVAVVILKYFLPESRKIYVSYWIAIGSIAVAGKITNI